MAQVEEGLAAAASAHAPAAAQALPPPVESRPPPARPSEESRDDSSDRRKKEKKEKKKKKRDKRERRERERSQGLWGWHGPAWGGVKGEGEGEVVVDEGNKDGAEGRKLRLLTPPPCPPPLPHWLLKALGPQSATARKAGAIGWSAQVLEPGCAGDQPVFSSPVHSHMTIM